MKQKKILSGLGLLLFAALVGFGPCEPPELSPSSEPIQRYRARMAEAGDLDVAFNQPLAYYLGRVMDPASVTALTVTLERASDGEDVSGTVSNFDPVACQILPGLMCPRGVGFTPGGGVPCDLDGDTVYNLILNGVVLANGDPLPLTTISFRTAPVPPGYVATYCSSATTYTLFAVSGATVDPVNGIGGDLTTETVKHLEIVAQAVEEVAPYNGYNRLGWRYDLILSVRNVGFADYDLDDTVKWVNVKVHGVNYKIYLPGLVIPAGRSLPLYIASDGSSYYAIQDGAAATDHTRDLSLGDCDSPGWGCPSYTPNVAYSSTLLAAGASGSPSLVPFVIEGDSIDMAAGVNGGIMDGATDWSDLIFIALAIEPAAPYYGWDQLNNYNEFGLGHAFGGYLYNLPTYLALSNFTMGRFEYAYFGTTFIPILNKINPFDAWLLLYIENKDVTAYNLMSRTVTITDAGTPLTVSLPDISIPAGEALPLYVADDGATFWAYGGTRTLDLWANGCESNCPLLTPVAAIANPPAAP